MSSARRKRDTAASLSAASSASAAAAAAASQARAKKAKTSGDDTGVVTSRAAVNASMSVRGESALHLAAAKGDVDEVRRLLKLGAFVSQRRVNGDTPLHIAASRNNSYYLSPLPGDFAGVVAVLLEHGADVNARNALQRRTINQCVCSAAIYELLLAKMSADDVNAEESDGVLVESPLSFAALSCDVALVRTLLANGVRLPTASGAWTPLIAATAEDPLEHTDEQLCGMLAFLLKLPGVDKPYIDRQYRGQTALTLACMNVCCLLLPDVVNRSQSTALVVRRVTRKRSRCLSLAARVCRSASR